MSFDLVTLRLHLLPVDVFLKISLIENLFDNTLVDVHTFLATPLQTF